LSASEMKFLIQNFLRSCVVTTEGGVVKFHGVKVQQTKAILFDPDQTDTIRFDRTATLERF
jgi:hypothetical protein